MKRLLNTTVISLIFIIIGCSGNYKDEYKTVYKDLIKLSNQSTELSERVEKTWYDVIHNSRYFSYDEGKIKNTSSTNTALSWLFEEEDVVLAVVRIERQKKEIKGKISNLKNPPKKFETLYSDLIDIYSNVVEISNLAIKPSGSYISYNEKIEELESKINTKKSQIEVRLP